MRERRDVAPTETPPTPLVMRLLDGVERVGNRLPDPITLFLVFAFLVVLASRVTSSLGVTVIHPATGEPVAVVDLASADGVRRMLAEATKNFAGFPPLGTVLVTMLGVGIAEQSGLFSAALRRLVTVVPPQALTATLVFAGVMSSAAADAGLVVLTPLGALLFLSVGRHPLAGLCAAFAGVAGGFSANLLITSLDPLLAGLTEPAARLIDPAYVVAPTANYYFLIASTFLLTIVGTFVNNRYVEPRFGPYRPKGDATPSMPVDVTVAERRGLRHAGITLVVLAGGVLYLVVPDGAVLRTPTGDLKPFYDSIVSLITLAFLLPGLAFGRAAGTIRSDKDVAKMAADTMGTMGAYIALAFVASQFVSYFAWSNLGIVLAVSGAGLLKSIGLSGVPLLIGFVLLAATINLLIASASAKWAVMATVFVPMLMLMGYSPEAVQVAYRVGDSVTNVVTPLLPYYPLLIAFARKYDPSCGMGTLISSTLPYSVGFGIAWTLMLIAWVLLDLPLGPGAPVHYMPAAVR